MAKYVDAFSPDLTGAGYSPMKESPDYNASLVASQAQSLLDEHLTMFYWFRQASIATLSTYNLANKAHL